MKTIAMLLIGGILGFTACQNQSEIVQPTNTKTKSAKMAAVGSIEIIPLNGLINGLNYKQMATAAALKETSGSFAQSLYADPDGSWHIQANQPVAGITILASNFGGESTRSLSLPESNYIFMPLMWYLAWDFQDTSCPGILNRSQTGFTRDLRELQTAQDLELTIDGQSYSSGLKNNRIETDYVPTTLHADFNINKCTSTDLKGIIKASGYYVAIKLPAGQHTVRFGGRKGNFSSYVTWTLNVTPSIIAPI